MITKNLKRKLFIKQQIVDFVRVREFVQCFHTVYCNLLPVWAEVAGHFDVHKVVIKNQ